MRVDHRLDQQRTPGEIPIGQWLNPQIQDMQAIQQYASECRSVLREGGPTNSEWFFDEQENFPDFAFLRYFGSSPFKGGVHDHFAYFEVRLSPEMNEGILHVCTLEVGPTLVRSRPSQNHARIHENSIAVAFETRSEKHHLEGRLTIDRRGDGCISGIGAVDYALMHIHPGTKEPTKGINAREDPVIKRTEISCPKCLGTGQFSSMSIPEEDQTRGLAGYALYSENKVSGHTGCPMCGGSGRSYEDWFMKEKGISTHNSGPMVPGTGRVVIGSDLDT